VLGNYTFYILIAILQNIGFILLCILFNNYLQRQQKHTHTKKTNLHNKNTFKAFLNCHRFTPDWRSPNTC